MAGPIGRYPAVGRRRRIALLPAAALIIAMVGVAQPAVADDAPLPFTTSPAPSIVSDG